MNVASLQYCYSFPKDFDAYREKITKLVQNHAKRKIELLLFPEYAGMEMSSFAPGNRLQDFLPAYLELFQELSARYRMVICSGTQAVITSAGTFNRSFLFTPDKKIHHQDKCILTPYENQEGIFSSGSNINLFEVEPFGKIGICICYDSEFPPLAKQLAFSGAKLILVPSYTSSMHGFNRVFISCRARALENQCYVMQSALVGQTDVEIAYGAASICSPIDLEFPEDGILSLGKKNRSGSISAVLDYKKLEKVRTEGETRNFTDARKLEKSTLLGYNKYTAPA